MKYLKLFEQVDWDNDPFGEDSYAPEEYHIILYGGDHYLVESTNDYTVKFFSNHKTLLESDNIARFYINKDDINPKTEIFLFNYGEILPNKNYSSIRFEDLPEEIKNNLA